jgi:putative lipoprotein
MMYGLALLFVLHSGDGPAPRDRWFSPDKAKHFFISAFVQSISFSALRATGASRNASFVGASAVSVGVGVGREVYDLYRPGGVSSFKDIAWDAAGVLAATELLRHTSR